MKKLLILSMLLISTMSHADIWEEVKKGRIYGNITFGQIAEQTELVFYDENGNVSKNDCDISARLDLGVRWAVNPYLDINLDLWQHNSNLDCGSPFNKKAEFTKDVKPALGIMFYFN